MTQLQALSTQQLDAYKSRIDNAGTLEQKKAAAIADNTTTNKTSQR